MAAAAAVVGFAVFVLGMLPQLLAYSGTERHPSPVAAGDRAR